MQAPEATGFKGALFANVQWQRDVGVADSSDHRPAGSEFFSLRTSRETQNRLGGALLPSICAEIRGLLS